MINELSAFAPLDEAITAFPLVAVGVPMVYTSPSEFK